MAVGDSPERLKKRAEAQKRYLSSQKGKDCHKRYTERNREKISKVARNTYLKTNYGITQEAYEALLKEQNSACAICSIKAPNSTNKYLHVDHCHTSGKIRSLLCSRCNTAIGLLKESTLVAFKAFKYLVKHKYGN